jgi:hypothetical protein
VYDLALNEVIKWIVFYKPYHQIIIPPYPPYQFTIESGSEDTHAKAQATPIDDQKLEPIDEDEDELDFSICEQGVDPPLQVEPDNFSHATDHPTIHDCKRQASLALGIDVFTPSSKRRRENIEKSLLGLEQWRVGKTPGHQGSHRKDSERVHAKSVLGEKRSLNQVRWTPFFKSSCDILLLLPL